MPYCSSCGNQVAETDIFCAKCGRRQPMTLKPKGVFATVSPRTASMLCYVPVLGWIPAIVVLASEKFRDNRVVRFHAFQGLYLFVAWLIVDQVIRPVFHFMPGPHFLGVSTILKLLLFLAWGWMLIKTSHEEQYSLPIIGELAERSVAER
jgi:uncharacterized membrane protein